MEQVVTPWDLVGRCQSMQQQEYRLSEDSKDSTIKQSLIEQNESCEL